VCGRLPADDVVLTVTVASVACQSGAAYVILACSVMSADSRSRAHLQKAAIICLMISDLAVSTSLTAAAEVFASM
jgi:hypothetical protein